MKELLNRFKADVVLSAVLCVITGVVVMIWPATVTLIVGRVIGVILVVMGLKHAFSYLQDKETSRLGLASGVVIFVLGVVILIRPELVAQMVAVVVGVLLIMHGLEDMQLGVESKQCGDGSWWICILFSLATILLGVFVIVKYFQMAEVAAWFLGLALVFDGVSDLIVVVRVTRAAKHMKQDAEAIDVEWKE